MKKAMIQAVRFIFLATLISMTVACGSSTDAAKEEAHGHSHD